MTPLPLNPCLPKLSLDGVLPTPGHSTSFLYPETYNIVQQPRFSERLGIRLNSGKQSLQPRKLAPTSLMITFSVIHRTPPPHPIPTPLLLLPFYITPIAVNLTGFFFFLEMLLTFLLLCSSFSFIHLGMLHIIVVICTPVRRGRFGEVAKASFSSPPPFFFLNVRVEIIIVMVCS